MSKGFQTKKSLGQNFISDPGIISEIADAALISKEDTVVEIGPGLGALTEELADRAKRVIAVELDDRLIPILRAKFLTMGNVEIVHQDILEYDWSKALSDPGGELRIVGNLPYYITTPILLGILEKRVPARSITVMVQKEVAERITADPGGRDFGVLSVSLQYYCECEKVLDVPREYFSPVPKVDSAVVRLMLRDRSTWPLDDSGESLFFALVKKAFSQRRKTLLNSLEGFRGLDKTHIEEILTKNDILPSQRAETLGVAEYIALSKEIKNAGY